LIGIITAFPGLSRTAHVVVTVSSFKSLDKLLLMMKELIHELGSDILETNSRAFMLFDFL